ncbi:hypothetical protein [Phenylobacterium sp.]|uniref:hypothetical protein n=1 Tax=Phenylobacterium sp. TaxID=1871053 RepID=UPI00086BAF44|nr:MAG: hypothetical protein ABS77_04655 [Phenylobacterium sp. SCN 69-14]
MSKTSLFLRPATCKSLVLAGLMSGLMTTAAAAQDLAPLSVTGARPESLTIRIAGLESGGVYKAVRGAAFTVCRNAVSNGGLDLFDLDWCADKASARTMRSYHSALRDAGGEFRSASLTIMVAAR